MKDRTIVNLLSASLITLAVILFANVFVLLYSAQTYYHQKADNREMMHILNNLKMITNEGTIVHDTIR